ncbi:serine hydrolase domain-containing protein [Xanthocytophaga flava]|uniref:serine hydrolase domain-containing protein n=1 Tax=Xanthocytophaga flava TaxID=3048013 RepID=UPI0028D01C6B|nr:serine hydrolase [Xanthocytophaga flavus]MDJ1473751.1 serine hydrolase [Xanthocytophaga flavus]
MSYKLFVPFLCTLIGIATLSELAAQNQKAKIKTAYFPPAQSWQHQTPQSVGLNGTKLSEAISFAIANETQAPRSMEANHYRTFGKEPFGDGIGPFADRGAPTGIIVYKGYIVAEWGEPQRVDMTHSVTKSFLSTVVGLAVDQGLIRSVQDTVAPYVPPIEVYNPQQSISRPAEDIGQSELIRPFATPHNQTITWDNLLRQTSDWEGTLWGKPEWADRPSANASEWQTRPRNKPGTVYEYNDVRVNALSLAALSVWRKPLPQVLKTYIMDPIGASNTWRWNGYRNAWIVLDGQAVQSVSGGGHWGGGMFINAYDMARFGLLTLHKGNWNGKQLISTQWVAQALTPTTPEPTYGYMNWFLNTDKKYLPSAPVTAFAHIGNGTNMIYVDPEHELVVVARWIDNKALDGMVKRVLDAFPETK